MTNSNHTVEETVPVIQADRDAAADVIKHYRGMKDNDWQGRCRRGETDDGFIVQAFARHRLASHSTHSDELVEALKPFADAADLYSWPVYEPDDFHTGLGSTTVGDLRKARAALTKGPYNG